MVLIRLIMMKVVSVEQAVTSAPKRKAEEIQKISSLMREYISLHGEDIINILRQDGRVDFNSIKGIRIETLFALTLGRSQGASKFIYFSPGAGKANEIMLLSGKKHPSHSFLLERIGGRKVTASIFQ